MIELDLEMDRRKELRRDRDKICDDCLVFRERLKVVEKNAEVTDKKISTALSVAHRRIDDMVPIWVFSLVTAVYLCISGYQTVKMVEMSNQMAVLQTKMASVEEVIKRK